MLDYNMTDAIAYIIRECRYAVPPESTDMYISYLTARLARYFHTLDDDFDSKTFRDSCYRAQQEEA